MVETAKNRQAAALFDAAAEGYDTWARLFSFGQYGRWRRALIDALAPQPDSLVLDVCTGTAGVAIEIARRRGSRVVGIDISPGMLAEGQRRVEEAGLDRMVTLQPARAEVVLGGALILRTIVTNLGHDRFTVIDRGLRHGLLAERFGG